jgi:hypothetical protein
MDFFFVLASALRARSYSAIAGALALQRRGMPTRNDLLRDTVGFDFVGLSGLADAQLRPKDASLEQLQHCLITRDLLETGEWIREQW